MDKYKISILKIYFGHITGHKYKMSSLKINVTGHKYKIFKINFGHND